MIVTALAPGPQGPRGPVGRAIAGGRRAARRAAGRIADRDPGEPLELRTEDGFALYGRLAAASRSRACVVLCHGITSDCREDGLFTRFAREAPRRGLSCIRFDFRGHGASEGSDRDFSLEAQRRDLEAVLAVAGDLGLGPRVLLAMSFGASPAVTAVAAAVAAGAPGAPVPALVLWSPVADYRATLFGALTPWSAELLAGRDDPSLPGWAAATAPGDEFRISRALAAECEADLTAATLAAARFPILAFATPEDPVVPFSPLSDLAQRNGAIDLRTVPGARHGLQGNHPRIVEETLAWIEERL